MQQALINCHIHTGQPSETGETNETSAAIRPNGIILIDNGTIIALPTEIPQDCQTIDGKGTHIAPGFIDIQLNGGEQFNFTADPTEETIEDMYRSSLRTGATHLLPTMISSPKENILKGIEAIKNYRSRHNNGVIGMHLEGPFINVQKRGAHLPANIRKPSNDELAEIIRYGKDVIKLITIAPEYFTDEHIEMLISAGITVSAGHSNITYREAQHCFGQGIKLVTHLFNAMSPFNHREPGLVGAALENDTVYTPVIVDGAHCDYGAASLAYKIKKEKLLLVTDALFLNRKKKQFNWDSFNVRLVDGFYRNEDGNLAGATISMAEAVQNAHTHLDIPIDEAIKMATSRVAAAIGMDQGIGRIAPGYPASFTRFDDTLQKIDTLVF